MGKALSDVRDTGQKYRLMPMSRIGAVNVLVPMVGIRTVLHQMTERVIRPARTLLLHLASLIPEMDSAMREATFSAKA